MKPLDKVILFEIIIIGKNSVHILVYFLQDLLMIFAFTSSGITHILLELHLFIRPLCGITLLLINFIIDNTVSAKREHECSGSGVKTELVTC